MKLIIETETAAQMEAVVSFLRVAVNMQRDANSIIDFREPEEVEACYGFSVSEYNAAMLAVLTAKQIPLKLNGYYDEKETPSYNLAKQIRWGTDDERTDLAFWLEKFFGL